MYCADIPVESVVPKAIDAFAETFKMDCVNLQEARTGEEQSLVREFLEMITRH
jgi:hypothetical protein